MPNTVIEYNTHLIFIHSKALLQQPVVYILQPNAKKKNNHYSNPSVTVLTFNSKGKDRRSFSPTHRACRPKSKSSLRNHPADQHVSFCINELKEVHSPTLLYPEYTRIQVCALLLFRIRARFVPSHAYEV